MPHLHLAFAPFLNLHIVSQSPGNPSRLLLIIFCILLYIASASYYEVIYILPPSIMDFVIWEDVIKQLSHVAQRRKL
jgi:hypothetical protein